MTYVIHSACVDYFYFSPQPHYFSSPSSLPVITWIIVLPFTNETVYFGLFQCARRSFLDCGPSLPPTPRPRGVNHQRMSSSSSVSSTASSTATTSEAGSDSSGAFSVRNTLPNGSTCTPLSRRMTSRQSPLKPACLSFKISSVKCWDDAKSQSFYARDNVTNFIKWCRHLGVREAVIFETEDLVLHNNQRNVVLCLLEVARIICKKYGYTIVPGLVELEKEIDQIEREEELQIQLTSALNVADEKRFSHQHEQLSASRNNDDENIQECSSEQASPSTPPPPLPSPSPSPHPSPSSSSSSSGETCAPADTIDTRMTGESEGDALDGTIDRETEITCHDQEIEHEKKDKLIDETITLNNNLPGITPSPCVSLISLTSTGGECDSSISSPMPCESLTNQSIDSYNEVNSSNIMVSQLDQKVMLIAKSFYGKKAKQGIQRLEEGKYRIAGKIVFVRVSSTSAVSFTPLSSFHQQSLSVCMYVCV